MGNSESSPDPVKCPEAQKCPDPIKCPEAQKCPDPIKCPEAPKGVIKPMSVEEKTAYLDCMQKEYNPCKKPGLSGPNPSVDWKCVAEIHRDPSTADLPMSTIEEKCYQFAQANPRAPTVASIAPISVSK